MNKTSGKPYWLFILLLMIWEIFLTFQGLDLADTGFQLTAFRFIFDAPYSVQYSMMFWFSDVCGALWMKLFPAGGLYWFKIGWVVFINLGLIFYSRLLRETLSKRETIIGLALTTVFILRGGPECLNYDIFSTFGYAAGIATIYLGLTRNRSGLLLLSGFVFGMSVFFKLSNLSALAFLILIPYFSLLQKETFRRFLKKSALWLSGFLIGMALILITIALVGHYQLFIDNLRFLSKMGADSQASHGLMPMITSYLSGYVNAIVMLVIAGVILLLYVHLSKKFKSFQSNNIQLFLLFLILGLTIVLSIYFREAFWSKIRYLFIGLMIIAGVQGLTNIILSHEKRLLYLAGLLLLLIVPLGSDSGLAKSVWGMWILGPLVISNFFKTEYLDKFGLNISLRQSIFIKRYFITILLVSAVFYAWQHTYFDVGSRIQKTATIDHPKLKFIYTSEKRAHVMNELIREGFPKIKEQQYLLSFIEIPMLNYLTDKKPFLSTSWPKLYYSPATFKQKLYEALQKRKSYPAIIRQKQNTTINDWPSSTDPNYLSYPDSLSKWPEHGKILNEFMATNNYEVVWENEMFQVLITNRIRD
ncbi:MAG TPA: hypothetical protein VKA27_05715 [Sunxiuqinia sp.]|nr:hypothetical protein [Sunxiuqinia sp.]